MMIYDDDDANMIGGVCEDEEIYGWMWRCWEEDDNYHHWTGYDDDADDDDGANHFIALCKW